MSTVDPRPFAMAQTSARRPRRSASRRRQRRSGRRPGPTAPARARPRGRSGKSQTEQLSARRSRPESACDRGRLALFEQRAPSSVIASPRRAISTCRAVAGRSDPPHAPPSQSPGALDAAARARPRRGLGLRSGKSSATVVDAISGRRSSTVASTEAMLCTIAAAMRASITRWSCMSPVAALRGTREPGPPAGSSWAMALSACGGQVLRRPECFSQPSVGPP